MKVIIVGAGALGSVIGACLARTGEEVVLVDVPNPHLDLISRQGLRVKGWQDFSVPVKTTTDPSQLREADLLLFLTKSMDTEQALERVAHLRIQCAVSLQNGVIKEERLGRVFGSDKVLGGLTLIGAQRPGPGVVEWTAEGITYFGELDGKRSQRGEQIVDTFKRSGLKAELREDILSLEWSKFISWAATGMMSALTRLPFPRLLQNPELASLLVRMVRELSRIPEARGITLQDCGPHRTRTMLDKPLAEAVQEVIQAGSRMERAGSLPYHSTAQDILAGRRTEMEDCIGPLIAEARERAIEIPLTAAVYALARGLESSLGLSRDR